MIRRPNLSERRLRDLAIAMHNEVDKRGLALTSTEHPVAPWWKRLWLLLFHRDIDPKTIETVEEQPMIDACAKFGPGRAKDIDRRVFDALCKWRELDNKDTIILTRNEVCSILEHCRRNGMKIP